jgi:hypothetical protein
VPDPDVLHKAADLGRTLMTAEPCRHILRDSSMAARFPPIVNRSPS